MRLKGRAGAWVAVLAGMVAMAAVAVPSVHAGDVSSADVDSALGRATGSVGVIVQETATGSDARSLVVSAGGEITVELPIVNGFAARVDGEAIDRLGRLPGVRAITLDRQVSVQGTGAASTIRSVYPAAVRADDTWAAGLNGAGVTVALIDTGISPVNDLAGRILPVRDDITGEVTPCVNMSGETHCNDSYGHGTFLAGLIAGNGADSAGKWKGIAPAANLVSIKIAGRDGSADVSGVLAAIQWVVSFKDQYGIRVLNLSLGTDGTQSYRTDPMNYAVERAWDSGIVVVVSASNRGPAAGTIAKPGDDPLVITAGAVDDRGTKKINDDRLPDFSGRGPTAADGLAKPDLTAPGAHLVSLRAPGSAVDTNFPATIDGSYRRASGTSMSAAVVSGAAALVAQARPSWSPNRVKFALRSTARAVAGGNALEVGAGEIDVFAATFQAPAGEANAGVERSNGSGSLDASRGTVQVQMDDPLATVLSGLLTAQLLLWDPIAYTDAEWTGAKWYGAKWYGAKWYGAKWYGDTWQGAKWYGAKWYEGSDPTETYGSEWYGAKWYGAWE